MTSREKKVLFNYYDNADKLFNAYTMMHQLSPENDITEEIMKQYGRMRMQIVMILIDLGILDECIGRKQNEEA